MPSLDAVKKQLFATKSMFLSTSARTLSQQQVNGSTNSSRLKKSSLSPLRSTGTCHPPSHHQSKQMNTQQETEQMFPKLLLSWLSEVQKRHGEPSQTQQVVTSWANHHQIETSERQRKNEKHLYCLRHMYYFSQLNMALSKRLLEENGQFDHIRKEQTIHDLHCTNVYFHGLKMEYLFPSEHEGSGVNQNKKLVGAKQQEMHHKDTSKIFRFLKEKKTLKQEKKKEFVEIIEDEKNNITPFTKDEMNSVPLTLEDVALYNPVLEAKVLDNYWTNYADQDPINNKEKY
ncbi:hypothetical protein JD844_024763 [Phrynosoma platyrhinos]|uniref:Uncharacterized protein n=1 Tax=Phrynosoma platyrhinos TaxID=52577 RepID=A0ABQ7SZ45_PHRPL|nr:hypothetical protein JD844_024763 [Phrynosoma platyrhinos]